MKENGNTPLISVVIPLYNKEKVVLKTLYSVVKQNFADYEVVVVNDGSTDRSVEIVNESFSNQVNIRIINKSNGGVSSARNRGIQEAKGEYIAFLDADDEWLPEYLSTMADLIFKYPSIQVFASGYSYRNLNGLTSIRLKGIFTGDTNILDNYFVVASVSSPPLWTSAVIVKKNAICAIGGFPLGVRLGEDLITWAKLACKYEILYTKKSLAIYNQLAENYETGCYNFSILPTPDNDVVGKMLDELRSDFPHVVGIRRYVSHWHKIRFVMLVDYGRKLEAFQEWYKTWPYGLMKLDCYYRLFLNLLPCKFHSIIKQVIGKS